MGYLVRISFLGYNLKSYPDYHKISYNILSYPIISFHILSYPKISSGANSQMTAAMCTCKSRHYSAACIWNPLPLKKTSWLGLLRWTLCKAFTSKRFQFLAANLLHNRYNPDII